MRREVFERDGEQCTFVDDAGERCPSRGHLELDHLEARALGGTNAASNLRVRCRAHNRLAAEEVFGKAHVAERIDFRQRKSRAVAVSLPSPSPSPPPQVIELALRGLHNNVTPRPSDCPLVVVKLSNGTVWRIAQPSATTYWTGVFVVNQRELVAGEDSMAALVARALHRSAGGLGAREVSALCVWGAQAS